MDGHKEIDVTDVRSGSDNAVSQTSAMGSDSEPPIDEAKLLRKIDWHLLPILFAVYVVAFLDRQVTRCQSTPLFGGSRV